jgi:glycosyltransferase involved in cell wall biosynthesis
MKVAFICDYFLPHSPGGAEQSTFLLAKALVQKGIDVSIITPNYGANNHEIIKKVKIYRFPFIKLTKGKNKVSPILHTNFFWILYSAFQIYKISKAIKVDLIHIHGKFSLPGALITAKILKVKTIITLRDYRLLCPIGHCLFRKKRAGNFLNFLTKEIPFGIKHYLKKKNLTSILIYTLANIRSYFATKIFKFVVNLTDKKVFVSQKVKRIYHQNGIKDGLVIYNLLPAIPTLLTNNPQKLILYVGKLSFGKGTDLFLKTAQQLENKIPQYQFIIVGNSNLMKYKILAKKLKLMNTQFTGSLPHLKIKKFYEMAKLVVIPSRWQEPLSRVTLEALSLGVPVITTKKGGQEEIINHGKNGYIVKSNVASIKSAILKGIKENNTLRLNIKKEQKSFSDKFYTQVIIKHLKLYKGLIK